MGKKSMKFHIDNRNGNYVCGLKVKNHIPEAMWDDDSNALYTMQGEKIDHTNMNCVCSNCMKLFHPTYLNDLLIEKELIEYKQSLPKTNRERLRRNAMKRRNRHKKRNQSNVIHLPYTPIPRKPIALIEDQQWRELNKKAKVINKPKNQSKSKPKKQQLKQKQEKPIDMNEIVAINGEPINEIGQIDYGNGLSIIQGPIGKWMIVFTNDDKTIENMSGWIDYSDAHKQASELAA